MKLLAMKPMPVYFKNCNKDLAFLFDKYLYNLEQACRDVFFYRFPRYAKIVIQDMEFTGFYETRLLVQNGIPLLTAYVDEWDVDSARIYDGYKELIKVWEDLSQYQSILKFIGREDLFLKVLDNLDTLEKVVDSKQLNWLAKIEENFNVFKATKLIEGM